MSAAFAASACQPALWAARARGDHARALSAVLHRLARRDEALFDAALGIPCLHSVTSELSVFVGADQLGSPAFDLDLIEDSCHAQRRDWGVDGDLFDPFAAAVRYRQRLL